MMLTIIKLMIMLNVELASMNVFMECIEEENSLDYSFVLHLLVL